MKNFLIVSSTLLLVSLTQTTFASTVLHFDCKSEKSLEDRGPVRIQFNVSVSTSGKFGYADDSDNAFKVTPKNSQAALLNENSSIRQNKDKVEFFGDGDGFVLVYLTLYSNTDYKHGHIVYKDTGGVGLKGNLYSNVKCEVN